MPEALSSIRKISLSFWLFAAVFFTCTWDLLYAREVAGFTLKIYQPLALLSLLALLFEERHSGFRKILAPLLRPFPVCLGALGAFYILLSPWSAFPIKSFLYSGWLFFQLGAIYLTAQHVYRRNPGHFFLTLIWTTLLFLAYVILVDYVYYYYGFHGGLIGWNQDKITGLGLSRPHAFSSEPGYAATFMCLAVLTSVTASFRITANKTRFTIKLLLVLFAIVATTSRTGWFCLALGAALLVLAPLLVGGRIQWKLVGSLFGGALAIVAILLLTTPTASRQVMWDSFVGSIFKGSDTSGNSRIKAHVQAAGLAQETHFLGTGFGASYKYFKDRGGFDYNAQRPFDESMYGNDMLMSTWAQLLAEGGPVAVLLYLAAAVFLIRSLFRKYRTTKDPFVLGCFVSSVLFFFFAAFWLSNVNRGDVWVWFGLWGAAADDQRSV